MKTRSIARQTIFVVLLAEAFGAVAFSGLALFHESRVRLRAFDVMLAGRSDSLLGAIQDAEDPDDSVVIDPSELSVPSQDVYAVYNQDGRLVGASAGAPAVLIERRKNGLVDERTGPYHYRILQREAMRIIDRAENGGVGLRRPVVLLYAARTDRIWAEILEAAGFYTLLSSALFVVTAGVLILLLRRVLQPIEELAGAASVVSFKDLHFVSPKSALATRELQPLAEALSATITGLRHAAEKEQRFVSDAAHELKTGVAVVRSTIQLLMMHSRTEVEYTEGLNRLLDDNTRVEELVSRMLTLASVEQHPGRPPATSDFAQVIRRTVENLRSYAEVHSVAILVRAAAGIIVPLSKGAAEVLVSNLVMNAVQHSESGAQVHVCLDSSERAAQLSVQDAGVGISSEALPHVFDRFYREDSSRSRETGGAGLGLSICKSMIEGAGGSISIESAKGVGTTVRANLPLS